MRHELTLNGRGGDILPFAGLELLLHAADDLELAVGIDAGNVAGADEAILRKHGARALGIAVVTQHVHGAADQEFALFRQLGLHSRNGRAHIARTQRPRRRKVGNQGFGHAVAFREVQPQLPVPRENFGRQGSRSRGRVLHRTKAEPAEDPALDLPVENGNAQQRIQPLARYLGEHSLLDFQ